MLLQCFSIYDSKGLVFHAPFYQTSSPAAVRLFSDLINDPSTSLYKHPLDYTLWHVGSYDDQTGALTPLSPVRHVVDGNSLAATNSIQPPQAASSTPESFNG
ncbi:MAG: nonstructural protein [Microvirus sp.]|nr:MAG: nonstructural protein [Microvirus sp.]